MLYGRAISRKRILVINPNSSAEATASIDAGLEPLRMSGGPRIEVTRLHDGPLAIVTDSDVQSVVKPLRQMIEADDADAFVLACFSDPGFEDVRRSAGGRLVFGIGRSGILRATELLDDSQKFGIVALSSPSVERQKRMIAETGMLTRYAGSVAVEDSPTRIMSGEGFDALLSAATRLRDEFGAALVVLGCAGMAAHRRRLEEASSVPVIDPAQQATTSALGAIALAGY